MLTTITALMKQGKLKEAAERLHEFASGTGLDSETLTDIVVLSGNISELAKQEKRRKINAQEALDIKTRYAFELEDIISEIGKSNLQIANPAIIAGVDTTTPAQAIAASPARQNTSNISNHINISVNVSIENIITYEVKKNINDLSEGLSELKDQLKENDENKDALALAHEVEELDKNLDALKKAENKNELPASLKKIETFIKKLEDGNNYASKAFKLTKKGVDTLQKIGTNYNAIAQWVGMPQIPNLFL